MLTIKLCSLSKPVRESIFVDRIAFVDVDVAHIWDLGANGRLRMKGGAPKECYFYVFCEAVETKKPAPSFYTIKWGIPSNGFADTSYMTPNKRIEAATDATLPARHCINICFNCHFTVCFGDLRITT